MKKDAFKQFIADAVSNNGWTPDVPFLETKDYWFVFNYFHRKGRLAQYFQHDSDEAQYLGIGWTQSAIYSILNVSAGGYDYTWADPSGSDRILGDVWALPTEAIIELDGEERNDFRTRRVLIPVNIGSGRIVSAWIYLANGNFLRDGPVKVSKYGRYTYYGKDKYLEVV